MWVFCCGMVRSGSTLQFQLAAHLVERAGLGKRVEWVEPEHFPELRRKYLDYSGRKVVKTHACTDEMLSEFEKGNATGVYIYRDIRDVFVSNMSKTSKSFTELWDERLLDFCLSTFQQWTGLQGVLVSRYEDVIADLPKEVARIADHLGIAVDSQTCEEIASDYTVGKQLERISKLAATLAPESERASDAVYDPESMLHVDHIFSGASGRWREVLLPAEVALIQRRASEWLLANGYELADTPSVLEPVVEQLNQESEKLWAAESDRASRLDLIREQGQRLGDLEGERNDLGAKLEQLERHLEAAEADGANRLQTIQEQGNRLGQLEGERNDLRAQLDQLQRRFAEAEADRAARLEVIREQGVRLGELDGESNDLRAQLDQLERHLVATEADRAARLEVIHEQQRHLTELRAEIENLQAALTTVVGSTVYKVVRRLGRWARVEQALAGMKARRLSTGEQVGTGGEVAQGPADVDEQAQALLEQYEAGDRDLFSIYESHGLHITPVHYYSCLPEVSTLKEQLWEETSALVGIELNDSAQLRFLEQTCPRFKDEYDAFPYDPTVVPYQYYLNQEMFRAVDAEVLHCIIRRYRPQRIIEVGSGFSTYVIASAAVANAQEGHHAQVTVIDPNPNDVMRQGFPGLSTVLEKPVQDTDISLFNSLRENDVLFVDSSHVLHIDSDVRFLVLEVLPRLNPGVLVHFHDIFLPLHYPREWVVREHRFWTEQYMLQAFLAFNRDFEVVWAGSYMHIRHSDALALAFPSYDPLTVWPGSFWIRRLGNNRLAE
jgi:predicted  nucleic acid-binding Zn-ribbon protein